MKAKILVADDDAGVRRLLSRALGVTRDILCACDGDEAVRMAIAEKPALILLDVKMPGKDGLAVLSLLREDQRLRSIPVILLTGLSQVDDRVAGLNLGADDYITKPFSTEELGARVDSLLRRRARDLSANPLTCLPGSPAVEEEVGRRIGAKAPFAFVYFDLDNFKAYNDVYGYANGDEVLRETAKILLEALRAEGGERDFLGHIGGDDFVAITTPERAGFVARQAADLFDRRAPFFYTPADRERGAIHTVDRQGTARAFPLLTLSAGIASTERRALGHYAKVVEIASEMKRFVKSRVPNGRSAYAADRRNDAATAAQAAAAARLEAAGLNRAANILRPEAGGSPFYDRA